MKNTLLNQNVLKAKLLEKYNSFSDTYDQLQLFSKTPDHILKGRTEALLDFSTSLIDNGYEPVSIFVAINALIRSKGISIYPAYQFTSIDDFWKVIKLRRRGV